MIKNTFDEDLKTRIFNVNTLCNSYYLDSTLVWKYNIGVIKELIKDKNIFEIGCGRNAGLSKIVLENGARSYVGVDIDRFAIENSKKLMPDLNFVWDDSVYVLNNLDKFGLNEFDTQIMCISSGVMDNSILLSNSYIKKLIDTISKVTCVSGYSIHSGSMIRSDLSEFNFYFKKAGFLSLDLGWNDSFSVYKRV